MQALDDPERLVICPYDKNHTVFVSRLAWHLVRCRKNHKDEPMVICEYNHQHRVPKPEYQYHIDTCDDKFKLEARPRDVVDNDNVMEFPIKNLADPVNEKWDEEELNHPGYKFEEHIENKNVLRLMSVEKPSVKKQFRKDEQRRMNVLRSQNPADSSSTDEASGMSNVTSTLKGLHLDEDKPDLSLDQRISTDKTMYQVDEDSDGFQLPKKSNKKKENKNKK